MQFVGNKVRTEVQWIPGPGLSVVGCINPDTPGILAKIVVVDPAECHVEEGGGSILPKRKAEEVGIPLKDYLSPFFLTLR